METQIKSLKRLVWLLLVMNLATIALVAETRIVFLGTFNGVYDSITAIMQDLQTREISDRFSRGREGAYQ